jgi:hypothetical protein
LFGITHSSPDDPTSSDSRVTVEVADGGPTRPAVQGADCKNARDARVTEEVVVGPVDGPPSGCATTGVRVSVGPLATVRPTGC